MNSIVSIYRRFPTKEDCLTHLETVRWGDSPHCPYCKSERVSKHTGQHARDRGSFQIAERPPYIPFPHGVISRLISGYKP